MANRACQRVGVFCTWGAWGADNERGGIMMRTTTTKGAVIWMVVLLAALSIPSTSSVQAEDSHMKGSMVVPPTQARAVPIGERAVVASGAAEDTLKACQARIPESASAGQRMLAEQSCAGAEQTRNEIRLAPKL
jgi:hypothetical protein